MWNWIAKLEELRALGRPFVIVTVTNCSGSTPRETGAKMLVEAGGMIYGTIGGGNLEDLAIADTQAVLEKSAPEIRKYPLGAKTGQCCGGVVELLFEPVNSGPRLYLFGAGHVGQAVCRTLAGTPFTVTVIDERKEWIDSPEIPKGTVRFHGEWEDFLDEAPFDPEKTYVAVMTHRHDTDQDILAKIVKLPARYIGMIGSRGKWARFTQRLTERGFAEAELSRVRCPLGLDIGGKAPQEVAISLASEILKIHYGR